MDPPILRQHLLHRCTSIASPCIGVSARRAPGDARRAPLSTCASTRTLTPPGKVISIIRKRPACDVLHRRVELSRLRAMVGSPVRVCAAAEERAYDAGRNCMLLRLRRIQ
jgi:hypothetical protein